MERIIMIAARIFVKTIKRQRQLYRDGEAALDLVRVEITTEVAPYMYNFYT